MALRSLVLCTVSCWMVSGQPSKHNHHADRVATFHSQVPAQLRNQIAHIPSFSSGNAFRDKSMRIKPEDYGADPFGIRDSTVALQQAVDECVKRAKASPNGFFPGEEDHWGPVGDAGGCLVDLDGGEYVISKSLHIPELVANMQLGHGSIVADNKNFSVGDFLLVVGVRGSCKVPQGSCNMDINFPELFMSGSNVANAMQINNVMGVTVGPGGYFLNFTNYGLQINGGHEVLMDRCWLGETNFDYKFAEHGDAPNATAIEINSNDHYILNTIVFSSKIGVAVHGAAEVVTGVHVWFPVNQALSFPDTKAFYITKGGNRFTGCYADGGRVWFEGGGLQHNFWTGGFECCAGKGLGNVPHGIILYGDEIGPGLEIFNNIFGGGNIWHQSPSLELPSCSDPATGFPVSKTGVKCNGLRHDTGAKTKDACAKNCCGDLTCNVWQWSDDTSQWGGCWRGQSDQCEASTDGWTGGAKKAKNVPVPTVVDSRFTENSRALTSRASQTLSQTSATAWRFDFCHQLVVPKIASARVNLQAQSGFPRHAIRPTQNCTLLVETDEPVTGSMTVDVDISTYTSSPAEVFKLIV